MTRLHSNRLLSLAIVATFAILAASLAASPPASQKRLLAPDGFLMQEPACHLKGEHTLSPYCIEITCQIACELITIITEHGVQLACVCNLDDLEVSLQHSLLYPADGSAPRFLCPVECPYREERF